jgi:DNA polymerase III delta prime subunit
MNATEAYAEISRRLSRDFIPESADDLIGNARDIALILDKAVHLSKGSNNSPLCYLFAGEPGLGKSAVAAYFTKLIGADKWSVTKLNGTEVKIEKVQELANSINYKTLFGDWRVIRIEEADTIPQVAQVRFLTLLDELPNSTAVICTSNCKLDEFEKRFQSRFQVFEVEPPSAPDIAKFLHRFIDHDDSILRIAEFACGNVRQALKDTQGYLQAAA